MAITARKCVPVTSSWVAAFILTCDGKLAVWFKDGACCYYPASSEALFDLALSWASPGKFVRAWLYKKLAYQLIKPPCPAGACTDCPACPPVGTLPDPLHATVVKAATGTCTCIGTTTATLAYNAGIATWESGPFAWGTCGQTARLHFHCAGGVPQCSITFDTGCLLIAGAQANADAGYTCRPPNFVFSSIDVKGCCGGSTLNNKAKVTLTA